MLLYCIPEQILSGGRYLKKTTPAAESGTSPACNLKGGFPFRLGTTSYILPDEILPNLRYLCDRVDDVELVLFESDEFSNMPSPEDAEAMASIGREFDLTYTVHLPLDIALGSADEEERASSVGKCRRVIERMSPLEPFAWILHLHGDRRGELPSENMERWNGQNRRSLTELLACGPTPSTICIETLDYDFQHVAALVEEFNLSVCLDIGHLLMNGRNVQTHLDRWMTRARVFHLHGVNPQGTDHCHLGHLPGGLLEDLAGRLSLEEERVLTMEIFGKDDFERSMNVIAERLSSWRK